jgi:hypothetical protein
LIFRKNKTKKACAYVKKNEFHKRSINKVEEITSFYQSLSLSSLGMTLLLSIRYFFGIEEENAKKYEVLGWIMRDDV